ncbi:sugar transferase [Bacteroides faecis]|nr:sugar transferase [Bacteroides faecis]
MFVQGFLDILRLITETVLGFAKKRLKDAWYADNISFCLDVKIFFKTIVTVLKHDNVYTN